MKIRMKVVFLTLTLLSSLAVAGVESSVTGTVLDDQAVAVSDAKVQLQNLEGKTLKETSTGIDGSYRFFPVNFGTYKIHVVQKDYQDSLNEVSVSSGSTSRMDIHLVPAGSHEIVVNVTAQRHLVHASESGSKVDVDHTQIEKLPQGEDISLPQLIATTTPGVISGPFGQTFIRGNHANIQYQIDGVQFPDSPSNTFGQAFSPRNIDHMEVITGGIPAEYGERMAAVVNIVTKNGPETPQGEVELGYGSYNTATANVNYGGSNKDGDIHYYFNVTLDRTDRGLDTPNPHSESDQKVGGKDAIHDTSTGNDEFGRIDWQMDNNNKVSLNLYNSIRSYQIPNFPSSFQPTDSYFQSNYTDQFGNNNPSGPLFNYTPPGTNDSQVEQNSYIQAVLKHTFSETAFLLVAPYYKYSSIHELNDPTNDLATGTGGATPISGATPSSFAMHRHVDNYGVKSDFTWRVNDNNLVKTGLQLQNSRASGAFSLQTSIVTAPYTEDGVDSGNTEALYIQDSWTINKYFTLHAGLRYSAVQYNFNIGSSDENTSSDGLLQPRLSLEYFPVEGTKFHVFYGKLFQPAPMEDLREVFVVAGGGTAQPYNIQAEKDDYYEIGWSQQIQQQLLATVNYYYKNATNMLDDTQLLNTPIAQPYNFSKGYADGIELSLTATWNTQLSSFLNYAHEDAKGKGISGGQFAFATEPDPNTYYYLDHVQIDTANLGTTFAKDNYWITGEALYGSGLRTGANNSESLPWHLTFDLSGGYEFKGNDWYTKFKLSGDIINITDDAYPITIANGYNGSHYAAGREFFGRISKSF